MSRWYRAPELILGNCQYTPTVDVWSAGCILAEMILGDPIFPGNDLSDQMLRIVGILGSPSLSDVKGMVPHCRTPEKFVPRQNIPPISFYKFFPSKDHDFVDILSKMLVYDPSKRWTTSKLLRHPIFAVFGSEQ